MIEPDDGIVININSTDSPELVAAKTKKAIQQHDEPIDGEYEDITDKRALPGADYDQKRIM